MKKLTIYIYIFRKQDEVIDIILERGNELRYTDSKKNIIIPFSDNEEQIIYSKLRDNPLIFQEDKLQKITNKDHGIEKNSTDFIAILTKSPKYKQQDDSTIQPVDKTEKKPDSASKIRLLTIRKSLIDDTLAWCESQESENNPNPLNCICKDMLGNCSTVDEYIRYMLRNNKNFNGKETPVNDLLKHPTHRTYMVSIAKMARHIKNGGGHLSISKEIEK